MRFEEEDDWLAMPDYVKQHGNPRTNGLNHTIQWYKGQEGVLILSGKVKMKKANIQKVGIHQKLHDTVAGSCQFGPNDIDE
eukprot:8043025-Alexandrium_andersonii.AAC.1